jgi:hypothetical protein
MQIEHIMHFFLYCRVNQYTEQEKEIRRVATYGAKFWTLSKDIAEPQLLLQEMF